MDNLLTRYLNLVVLAGVLSAQIIGLGVQIKREDGLHSTRLVRVWTVTIITPVERAIVWTQTAVRGVWDSYINLRKVRQENLALKEEIERLRREQIQTAQDADQGRRLQRLLAFREQFISATLPAQVIGWSGSEQSRAIYIDKGERDGVARDMAIITADGVVGKILEVYPGTSLVLLINDQSSGLGAILEKSRQQGVLRGLASGETVLERVMSDESVPVGERVLTSGGDGIYVKGLPVGVVDSVTKKPSEIFWTIRVRPAASLSRLEEVLIVTKRQESEVSPAEAAKNTRAVDILSGRLPGVPPKAPENAPGSQAVAPGLTTGAQAPPPRKPKVTPADQSTASGVKPAAPPSPTRSAEPAPQPASATEGDKPQ